MCRAVDEDLEVDISWGLSELFKQQPAGEQSTMLDKLRSELQRCGRPGRA